jgi:hypothetical protein
MVDRELSEKNKEIQLLVRSLYPNLSSNAVIGKTLRDAINKALS